MQRHLLAHAGDGLGQAVGFHRLQQIIHGAHLEGVQRMLAVRGHEHHSGRELQVAHRIGQLQAGGLGHVHVQEHDIAGIFLQLLDGLTDTGRLGNHFDSANLVKQEPQFRPSRRFIVNDDGFKHNNLPKCAWNVKFYILYSRITAWQKWPPIILFFHNCR